MEWKLKAKLQSKGLLWKSLVWWEQSINSKVHIVISSLNALLVISIPEYFILLDRVCWLLWRFHFTSSPVDTTGILRKFLQSGVNFLLGSCHWHRYPYWKSSILFLFWWQLKSLDLPFSVLVAMVTRTKREGKSSLWNSQAACKT